MADYVQIECLYNVNKVGSAVLLWVQAVRCEERGSQGQVWRGDAEGGQRHGGLQWPHHPTGLRLHSCLLGHQIQDKIT